MQAKKGFSAKREDATANSVMLYCLRVSQHPSFPLNLDSCRSPEPVTRNQCLPKTVLLHLCISHMCWLRVACLLLADLCQGPLPYLKLLETAKQEQTNATSQDNVYWEFCQQAPAISCATQNHRPFCIQENSPRTLNI